MKITFKSILATALALAALHGCTNSSDVSAPAPKKAENGARTGVPPQPSAQDRVPTGAADAGSPRSAGGFGGCQTQFANGTPPVVKDLAKRNGRALCFNGFAVMHSGTTKTPIYVAEVLSPSRVQNAKGEERTDKFFADARLPSAERATLHDYVGSGFDRGHNSPAGDQEDSASMAQSFSLANMMPQAPQNNRKAWASIEKSTRKYALRAQGNVYVITGSLLVPGQCPKYDASLFKLTGTCLIGNGVTVPSHIYKLVYDATTHRAWAHWIENTDSARITAPISYDELVKRTGIQFLPGIQPTT